MDVNLWTIASSLLIGYEVPEFWLASSCYIISLQLFHFVSQKSGTDIGGGVPEGPDPAHFRPKVAMKTTVYKNR